MKDSTTAQTPSASSIDRLADLTRRIVKVKKSELPKAKPTKRKKA